METINIKGKLSEDIKKDGELLVRTDNNVPHGAGKTIVISEDVVKYYQQMYDEDNDYFKTTNISFIRILKVEDYVMRCRRGFEEKGGFDRALPIDMMIEYENTLKFMETANELMDMEEKESIRQASSKLILPSSSN